MLAAILARASPTDACQHLLIQEKILSLFRTPRLTCGNLPPTFVDLEATSCLYQLAALL